ncbi:MAG: hypothetical protein M3Q72_05340, partial [Actinomycetota bacterium]|nr:hypothetical protein [Actinomycetota bacterium]
MRTMSYLRLAALASLLLALTSAPLTARALPPIVAFTSPTTIDEGREVTLDVVVTDPEGDAVTWSWDTDNDGVFGELPGVSSFTVPATATDGPAMLRIGVQATDGTETRTVIRTIRVNNLDPVISTHPLTTGAVRREYRYEIGAEDAGGANDPLEYMLTLSPEGMMVEGSVITWTPTIDQRGRTFPVVLRVTDGDGGGADQSWMIALAQNTDPIGPTPQSPIERAHVAEDEPVTLVIENGSDPDGDPLVYFFGLSRNAQFDGSVIGSGEVEEQSGETTTWTTEDPLEPGLWYWQVWASDGNVETPVRFATVIVGTGALPDA